ncbi:MAG: Gp49 family protein [Candidatus Sphingomonas colombiensis]|nr:Gp49 family protein [Sphingomonas sp.]WEK43635.1 MAG: Gp49 family protein [Sphingomonas sp.]
METEGLKATEAECAEGRTAPRVSLSDIEANIAETHLFTAGAALASILACDGLDANYDRGLDILTVCMLVLRNGFTIIGKSAPASPANFDAELGRKLAYEDAVRQVWPLMGYELRERLHRADAA